MLLAERGAEVDGGHDFPTADELASSDVLVLFAAEGATIVGDERARLERYLARGGGIVVRSRAASVNPRSPRPRA